MYFKAVKRILDRAIGDYSNDNGLSVPTVHAAIANHIVATSAEHYNPAPNINYDNPLCRLGYLYVHAGANATLFERTLRGSDTLDAVLKARTGGELAVCTVGGGPGTELLGLCRHLLGRDSVPRHIRFTVLDGVKEWAETWAHLADEVDELLADRFGTERPIIHRTFQEMDVVDVAEYTSYAWLFRKVEIFVFNYLVSENKVRIDDFEKTLTIIVRKAQNLARFVFIDRLEAGTFRDDLRGVVTRSGLTIAEDFEINNCMEDPVADFECYPEAFGGGPGSRRFPRRWFQKKDGRPTVFTLVAYKPA